VTVKNRRRRAPRLLSVVLGATVTGLALTAVPFGSASATVGPFAPAATPAPNPAVDTQDVAVTMRDGITVFTSLFTPTAKAPAGGWPVVIFPGTYAGDGLNANKMAEKLAERGFVTASYIPRGLGASTGFIDLAGPKDVSDVSDVLTWTLAHAKSDPKRVGVAGISYGAGFIPMAIAKDPRFKAAAMLSGWGDMWKSLWPNDTDAVAAHIGLTSVGLAQGRLSDEGRKVLLDGVGGKQSAEGKAYTAARSGSTYLPQLRERSIPLYVSTAMNEMIWPADQTIDFYRKYPGPKHLDILPGDHATTELRMGEGVVGYTWEAGFQWLQQHLAGAPTTVAPGTVRVAPRAGDGTDVLESKNMSVFRTESYPSPDTSRSTKRYYLSSSSSAPFGPAPKRELTSTPGTGRATLAQGLNLMLTQGLPLFQGVAEVLTGAPSRVQLDLAAPDSTGVWRSPALLAPTSIRGSITAHLDLRPTAGTGTVVVYALDLAPDGTTFMIGHKPYTWAGAKPKASLPLDVAIPYQGYDLPAGHKLALAVSTSDVVYADSNPIGSKVTVGPRSYVDFPLK
jgi:predicted acyl esterase